MGAALTLTCLAVSAAASWRVVEVAGAVRTGGPGLMPSVPAPSSTIAEGGWIETGADGKIAMVRGADEVKVNPNSRILFFTTKAAGDPAILQSVGAVAYAASGPHLTIATPYLIAAPVNKSKFTVEVADGTASVAVTTGTVEVTAGAITVPVQAGHIGKAAGGPGAVSGVTIEKQ